MTPVRNLITLAILLIGTACFAEEDRHAHHRQMMQNSQGSGGSRVDIELPDAVLANQNGDQVNLQQDVFANRIVVVDFVYTTCTTVCPVLSAVFRQVQEQLDDTLGSDVVMVSISVDPTRDTPARLKQYAEKFNAGEDWSWLTGPRQDVVEVLDAFGAYTPNFEEHPAMVLVGDTREGTWERFLGFPAPANIVDRVEALRHERATTQAATHH